MSVFCHPDEGGILKLVNQQDPSFVGMTKNTHFMLGLL